MPDLHSQHPAGNYTTNRLIETRIDGRAKTLSASAPMNRRQERPPARLPVDFLPVSAHHTRQQ
jgi:hypothetical protein